MRKILYVISLLILPAVGFAQSNNIKGKTLKISQNSRLIGDVTVGSSSFDASSALTVTATDQGMLVPRMNTASRDAIGSPTTGLLIFNSQTAQFEYFDGTWKAVGSTAGDMLKSIYDTNSDNLVDDSDSLDGQPSSFYLARANHTGTQTASTISDFDTEVSNNASVSANTAKVTNVTTNLSEGTTTTTTVDVNSSDGTDATLAAASASRAGVMTKAKFDEVVVNNSKITNATHTGDVTGATALTIANKAVEIVMLDDGTDGELITWDATGVAATVATGSSGEVLTSNGVGTAPTFQASAGGPSFGANDQIPFTNIGGTDFDYSGNLTYVTNELRIGGTNFGRFRLLNSTGSPVVAMTADFNSFFNQDVSIGHSTVPASGNNLDVVGGIILSVATSSPGDNSFTGGNIFTLRSKYDSDPDVGPITIANFDIGIQTVMTSAGASPTGHLSFTVNGNTGLTVDENQLTTVKGINATSTDDVFIATDNVDTDLLRIKNNGDVITHQTLNFHADTSATNDTYGIVEPLLIAYVTGMNLYVNIEIANTGAATLQINALSAITIKKLHDQDLVTGDIEANQIIHIIYDGTNFQMLSQLAQ